MFWSRDQRIAGFRGRHRTFGGWAAAARMQEHTRTKKEEAVIVRQSYLGAHLLAEGLQLLLPNDARVAEPAAVGLNAGVGQLLGLVLLVDDLALLVALGLLAVHVEPPHLRQYVFVCTMAAAVHTAGYSQPRSRDMRSRWLSTFA